MSNTKKGCGRCFGNGKVFKPEGTTKADMIQCPKCNGTCFSDRNKKKKEYGKRQYHSKNTDIDIANSVEAV